MCIRHSARAILLNERDEIFLFRFDCTRITGGGIVWVTPGGGVKRGEDFQRALSRELFEELNLRVNASPPWIYTAEKRFFDAIGAFISHERYYLVRTVNPQFSFSNMESFERACTLDARWWNVDEIVASDEPFSPGNIGYLLKDLIAGNIPRNPTAIRL